MQICIQCRLISISALLAIVCFDLDCRLNLRWKYFLQCKIQTEITLCQSRSQLFSSQLRYPLNFFLLFQSRGLISQILSLKLKMSVSHLVRQLFHYLNVALFPSFVIARSFSICYHLVCFSFAFQNIAVHLFVPRLFSTSCIDHKKSGTLSY